MVNEHKLGNTKRGKIIIEEHDKGIAVKIRALHPIEVVGMLEIAKLQIVEGIGKSIRGDIETTDINDEII